MLTPRSADLSRGYRSISYRDLAHAVDGLARWAQWAIGVDHREETIAYIGLNDQRYFTTVTGLMKAGYRTMLPSPRNSREGQASLFRATGCRFLLHSEGMETFVETIKEAVPGLTTVQVESWDQMLRHGEEQDRDDHPFRGRYSSAADAKVLILHTSGSTGLPKPIFLTNAAIAVNRTHRFIPVPEGRQCVQALLFPEGKPLFTMAPYFHAMGAIVSAGTILNRGSLIQLPAERPINAQLIIDVINDTKPWSGIFAPAILEQVEAISGGLEALGTLENVFFGGAPLAHGSGDKINTVTRVQTIIGSTEAGLIPNLLPEDKDDWTYFEFVEGAGVQMQPEEDSDLFEMVVKKKPEYLQWQGVFATFPDIDEWRTKDLMAPHPSKAGLWTYIGRKDDWIVLSNGEKFNPVGFEKQVDSHPFLKGSMVVGQGRFQTGLILEPDWDVLPSDKDPHELLDDVWPMIEKANASAPAHGRVWRSKVAIAKRDKPFKRAAKGSLVRRQTVELFKNEVEALYSNEGSDDQLGKLEPGASLSDVKNFLRKVFKIKGLAIPEDAADDADLFAYGTDSLQVLALSSTLSHACKSAGRGTVSARDIYAHPTIGGLAKWLQSSGEQDDQTAGGAENKEEIMAKMVEKYTHGLPRFPAAQVSDRPEKHTVVVTGSTGSLGNYILQELIANPTVARVYCLNRSADAEARNRKSFDERKVATDFSKVTFLHTDFSKELFDLRKDIYDTMLQQVDIFIHNAWAVDFNKALESYEAVHVAGTRRCVDFSLASRYRAQIVFISSIASVGNWLSKHSTSDFVPEVLMEDHSLPIPGQGYAESKHVASIILAKASDKAGVPSTIVRTGQIAGPSEEGMVWNKHEWLPSIVISSRAMGIVPERLGNQDLVDWVPLDLAARTAVEVSQSRAEQLSKASADSATVAHLVNPRTVSWSHLVPAVREAIQRNTGRDVQVVPFKTWLSKLKAIEPTTENAEKIPGIKLIDFYEGLAREGAGLPRLATAQTAKSSRTLASMRAVDEEMLRTWMGQWWD
ncbi:Acetyl CoA synthetase-like protein [Teratosphaeria destructans]|uniref:Acetyl CoA synthetase-like protein n=1 Tax=Teratosphaeria destructans TaxID=418781 RepID=A0A9W7SMQ1_9PEZI|nr:Acetyl CoA synthetase-like protein [Teratosphaeria destructans]